MQKEWVDIKSTLFAYHNLLAGLWPIFIFCVACGVYEPLRLGPDWLQSPIMVFSLSVLIPFVTTGFISPYSFVGERLRGTLEPLLATPVSDQALLFGKIGMAVLYGWGVSLVSMVLGWGVINLFVTHGQLLSYPPGMVIPTILLSLLFSLLVATLCTIASFYAKTILEAQRGPVMALFIPMLLPALWIGPLMPETWKGLIIQFLPPLGATNLFPILIVLLILLDGIFMIIALSRFHRKQLLLE